MKYFSRVNLPERKPQNDFPHTLDQFEMVVEVKDNKIFKHLEKLPESDSIDIYEKIQSDNHGLDVYDLIKRYNAGDDTAIGVAVWDDGDFTPETMSALEMSNFIENQKLQFASSDIRVREHYDFDYDKYLHAQQTGEFAKFVKDLNTPKDILEAESKEVQDATKSE